MSEPQAFVPAHAPVAHPAPVARPAPVAHPLPVAFDPHGPSPRRRVPVGTPRSDAPFHDGRRVARLLHAPPFAGRTRLEGLRFHDLAPPPLPALDVVACIPARDEGERIVATLDALHRSLSRAPGRTGVVVAVNNSSDATAALVDAWAARGGHAVMCCAVRFDAAIADAGHARRLALDLGAAFARPDAVLLTSDADTRVRPDWASRLVAHVRGGAGAAAGRIDTDPAEFAAMPRHVREAEAAERRLFAAQDALWARLVPTRAQALGLRVGGASLAMDARAYARVGRMPTPPCGEDRAMVAAMLRCDERVVLDPTPTIETSCRLDARADGGLGGMLRARLGDADPRCDEALWPARDFALRALAWRHLREARRGRVRGAAALAAALGVSPQALVPACATHGRDWERLHALLLPPPRLRVSDARSETARARAILAGTTPGADVARLVREVASC